MEKPIDTGDGNSGLNITDTEQEVVEYLSPGEVLSRIQIIERVVIDSLNQLNRDFQEDMGTPHVIYGVVIVGSVARAMKGDRTTSLHTESDIDFVTISTEAPFDYVTDIENSIRCGLRAKRIFMDLQHLENIETDPAHIEEKVVKLSAEWGKDKPYYIITRDSTPKLSDRSSGKK